MAGLPVPNWFDVTEKSLRVDDVFKRAQHREGHPAFPVKKGHQPVCAEIADHAAIRGDHCGCAPARPRDRADRAMVTTISVRRLPARRILLALPLMAALAACGRAPTDDILRGGVPARTDLHATTALPAEAVRSVARKDAGWRLIYHPHRAPANAEQRAAAALCRLEGKRPEQLIVLPMAAPGDDPGARMIDVICG